MNRIDKKLLKLGFVKLEENEHGAIFEREEKEFNYIHVVDIMKKKSKKHLIFSYDKKVNEDYFNNAVGLTYEETKLFMKKYRQIKRKYKW